VAVFIVLAALVAFCGPGAAGAPQSKLARAVYITTSKACACTLKRCQAGDAVVARVFSGARQRLLSRVDMATDKDAASSYIQNYQVFALPALLMFDGQGKLLWSAQGELDKDEVAFKLGEFGG
jgi:hypothetical protein